MSLEGHLRVELRVRGRVQGVGYRWAAREQACLLGLRGWVRNQPDGSVLLVAQGADDAVEALALWCAQGPARARVERVERRALATADDLPSIFEVRV